MWRRLRGTTGNCSIISLCESVEIAGAFSDLLNPDRSCVYRKDGTRGAAASPYVRSTIPELVSHSCHNTMNTDSTNVVDRS